MLPDAKRHGATGIILFRRDHLGSAATRPWPAIDTRLPAASWAELVRV